MADENDDGQLSWKEINHLCKNNLAKYIGERDAEFLDSMSEYFTKLIFKCFETELDDEIPMHDIRDYILKVRSLRYLLTPRAKITATYYACSAGLIFKLAFRSLSTTNFSLLFIIFADLFWFSKNIKMGEN